MVITAQLIFIYLFNNINQFLISFILSIIYIFSFGTILFCINPNTDGFSILLITITFILYKKKSNWIYLMYPLLLFQREFAFIIFGIIAFFDILKNKANNTFFKIQLIVNILFFILYYTLRKTFFLTPVYANQVTESGFLNNLFYISLNVNDFIKQAFLTQNILFIYVFLLLINGKKNIQKNKQNLLLLLIFIFVTFIISRIAVANNNMGRFIHMFSPILIIEMLAPELTQMANHLKNKF